MNAGGLITTFRISNHPPLSRTLVEALHHPHELVTIRTAKMRDIEWNL